MLQHTEQGAWLAEASDADMRRLLDALYRVERLLCAVPDVDALLDAILEQSKQLVDAEGSSLLLYDSARDELYFHAALSDGGDTEALKRNVRLRVGEGVAGEAAACRCSINVRDARNDPRVHRDADDITQIKTRTLLAVPMLNHEDLVGVLEVVNKRSMDGFTDFDRHILEMFGGLAGVAITRARLIEENLRGAQLAAVGEAVAGLSHYTKNILTSLTGSVELLDRGFEEDNEKFIRQGWPVMKRSVGRLSTIVQDMLAYSHHREPNREACDARQLLEEARETFEGLLTQRHIVTRVQVDSACGPVSVDRDGIHRCLLNLLTNAADAIPDPGGRIDLDAVTDGHGGVSLRVSDNGPGVPARERERIFDPFYSTKGGKGTGLGLAVTAKIVQEHGGAIRVETGPLGGACFTIELPAAGGNV